MGAWLATGCGGTDVGADGQYVEDLSATRYPIVLAHGFDASPTNRWGFNDVAETLEADGHEVIVATVPPYASVETRAEHLAYVVHDVLMDGHDKVNIVAHSMGGLDARYLTSSLGYGNFVASVTTISTPHRGSNVADGVLKVLDGLAVDDELLDDVASLWGLTFNELAQDSDVRAALEGISLAEADRFNAENPDHPAVFYQSWAGVSSVAGLPNFKDEAACERFVHGHGKADVMAASLVPMASLAAHGLSLYPNDGMVRVQSAKWGQFHGCILADHLDEVGHGLDGPVERTGWNHRAFYREVARGLAERGF